jgi:hypothetical protein
MGNFPSYCMHQEYFLMRRWSLQWRKSCHWEHTCGLMAELSFGTLLKGFGLNFRVSSHSFRSLQSDSRFITWHFIADTSHVVTLYDGGGRAPLVKRSLHPSRHHCSSQGCQASGRSGDGHTARFILFPWDDEIWCSLHSVPLRWRNRVLASFCSPEMTK